MRPPASPQFRFLLRGSLLLLSMLALWWFFLLHPMLDGLRFVADLALGIAPGDSRVAAITVAPNGDWIVRVPISASIAARDPVQQAFGRAPGAPPVKIRSFQLAVDERIPTF